MPEPAKHIERFIRRVTLAVLARSRHGRHTVQIHAPERILLVRTDRIGDAIISTPFVAAVREQFPAARIDMLLGAKNAAVAPLLSGIDTVHILPSSMRGVPAMLRRLRRTRYDVAVNMLAGDSASAALLTALAGAACRVGFAGTASALYDVVVPVGPQAMHIAARTMQLAEAFGIASAPAGHTRPLHLVIPESSRRHASNLLAASATEPDRGPIVMINISASSRRKYWDAERIVRLALRLKEHAFTPMIAAAPGDAAEQQEIARRAGCSALPTAPAFADFAALLDFASIVVTPDTSVVHLAAALGKPTVLLAGSEALGATWGPWGVPSHTVSGEHGVASIDPEAVCDAVLELAGVRSPEHSTSSDS